MTSYEKAGSAFVVVFLTSALWPKLPDVSLIIMVIIAISLVFLKTLSAITLGALLGFVWACAMGHWYQSWQINPEVLGNNLIIEGVVSSISSAHEPPDKLTLSASSSNNNSAAVINSGSTRFMFKASKLGKQSTLKSPKLSLSWFDAEFVPKQGQELRLLVKLKAPFGVANPHGFRYQTWLASQNVVATGNVLKSASNSILKADTSIRQQSLDTLHALELRHGSWLKALSLGYREQFTDADWDLLQISGTAHLFAISGMHLGIVSAYCLWLLRRPLAIINLLIFQHQSNVSRYSFILASLLCIIYAYLAGFQIPVMRALFALLLWTYLKYNNLHWRLHSIFITLLIWFFVCFPFSILSISFWFSFTAVISIWIFLWRFPYRTHTTLLSKSIYFLKLQLWLALITTPVSVYVFSHLPLLALLANLVLVPWVSFVLVPLCLLGVVLMLLSLPHAKVFYLASYAMEPVLFVLSVLKAASLELGQYFLNIGFTAFLGRELSLVQMCLLYSLLLCWLIPHLLHKFLLLSAISMLVLSLWIQEDKAPSQLIAFDVGQSTALLLRHDNTVWLFDTGAKFPSGFSMAESVLFPYLEQENITLIHKTFISHLDSDHAGGLAAISENFNIHEVHQPADTCVAGNEFHQGSLSAYAIWPLSPESGHENNESCVLIVELNDTRVLFAGDIEMPAEQALVATGKAIDADILIAPHHGSKTSSTQSFVRAVSPQHVVFTAGYENRWGFPHAEVKQRYAAIGSKMYTTGKDGAIVFSFEDGEVSPSTYRKDAYRRWYFALPD